MKNGTFLNLMKSGILLVLAPCKFTHSLLRTTCLLWFISFFFYIWILNTRYTIPDTWFSILNTWCFTLYVLCYILCVYAIYLLLDLRCSMIDTQCLILYILCTQCSNALYFVFHTQCKETKRRWLGDAEKWKKKIRHKKTKEQKLKKWK